jgi:hypothetical protein
MLTRCVMRELVEDLRELRAKSADVDRAVFAEEPTPSEVVKHREQLLRFA